MRPIAKAALLIFTILLSSGITWASIPPHPRALERIRRGEIPAPYYMRHQAELRAKGINAPWAAPALKNMPRDRVDGYSRRFGPAVAPTGNYNALVILVDFSDKPAQTDSTFFDNLIFGEGSGTMRDYFSVVSYGNLDVVTVVNPSSLGWVRATQSHSYYVGAAGENGMGVYPNNSQSLVEEVVLAVDDSVDFSQYDNNNDGYVDALFVVHAGTGAEYTTSDYDLWSHAWWTHSSHRPVLDGVSIVRYSIEPEYWDLNEDDVFDAGEDMTFGVFAHEMGHAAFGLPDLYDYGDDGTDSRGLGRWSLMAGGAWNGGLGESPALPDAWSHIEMGYIDPIIHTGNVSGYSIAPVADSPEVHRLWTDGAVGSEYFLVENRRLLSYDVALPDSGLLIYHVDKTAPNNDHEWYPGYTGFGHYKVALEQADGLWELEKDSTSGYSGDPFPGSTNNTTFDFASTPNSNAYDGSGTMVAVTAIIDGGYDITADLQVTVANPPVIAVSPDSLWALLYIGDSAVQTLTIDNFAGTDTLYWQISLEKFGGSTIPFAKANYADWTGPAEQDHITVIPHHIDLAGATGDYFQLWDNVLPWTAEAVSWLSMSSTSGTILAGGSVDITVSFNSTGLEWGRYDANLLLTSNDPIRPGETILVSLAVTPISPPEITAITDQPDDEGGLLNLTWTASADDTAGGSYPIQYYRIWRREADEPSTTPRLSAASLGIGRSVPGSPQTTGWILRDSLDANYSTNYSVAVPTVIDSNHTGNHWVNLTVSAHVAQDSIIAAVSTVEWGYSIDNLPPVAPTGIYATSLDTAFSVGWEYNIFAVGDFWQFALYRGNDANFEPAAGDTAVLLTTETFFIDREGLDNSLTYYYRVAAVDTNNNQALSGVTDGVILELLAALGIPEEYALRQNYPNPFNPSTTLRFEAPRIGRVELVVYDLLGREVVRLIDRTMDPGYFDVTWNGRTASGAEVAGGLYFARMITPDYTRTIKMIMLK
ncbi:MAG: M6 family metalloprotease domain-containing protein [Candidatus Neomarinimicrobiota bacterium]